MVRGRNMKKAKKNIMKKAKVGKWKWTVSNIPTNKINKKRILKLKNPKEIWRNSKIIKTMRCLIPKRILIMTLNS